LQSQKPRINLLLLSLDESLKLKAFLPPLEVPPPKQQQKLSHHQPHHLEL
jgi:hypothetical protein